MATSTTFARLALGLALGLALVIAGFAFALFPRAAEGAPNRSPELAPDAVAMAPVLLELFTSEGCSSCPRADEKLEKLAKVGSFEGARLIVLAHHVDYWNELGWPDPFSSEQSTARQRAYATTARGMYTPEMVVDGQESRGSLGTNILSAARRPHAGVSVSVGPIVGGEGDVTLTVGALPPGAAADAELVLAVVQDHATVHVPRGENAGRTLSHVAIARSLRVLGHVSRDGARVGARVQLPSPIPPRAATTFSVVAFVQERGSRRVLGAASSPLGPR